MARLRARARSFVDLGHTLSERRDGGVTPHGSAYCKSSRERRFGSLAGQQSSCAYAWEGCRWCSRRRSRPPAPLSLSYLLISRPLGLRVSSHSGSSQQSPTLCLLLAPSATPRCFPMSEIRRVYIVDSFIARDQQYNAHSTSRIPTLSGHTFSGKLNCPYPDGRRLSPALLLFTHT